MKSLTLKSPAKLNLYLKVTGRRPDGYHNLVTLFHRISLGDGMRLIARKSGFSLKCRAAEGLPGGASVTNGEDNIITKAYRLLQARFPKLGGVSVRLDKKIPAGAGLGGGSSNAAFFLLGMKKLYRLPLSGPEIMKIGRKLGADVGFFLHNTRQAIGKGTGDDIAPMLCRVKHWLVLIVSDKPLSTPAVYRNLPKQLPPVSLTKVNSAVRLIAAFLEGKKYGRASELLQNDLEVPAFILRPSLQEIIKKINGHGVSTARMTGSGPTVFAMFSGAGEARKFALFLRRALPSQKIIVCNSF